MQRLLKTVEAARCSLRSIVFLLIAFCLPCATPAVAESMLSLATEMETTCEDSSECLAIPEASRFSRQRQLLWHVRVDSLAGASGSATHRSAGRLVFAGHRLGNGLLAPLRC